jgi:hypothetical protein
MGEISFWEDYAEAAGQTVEDLIEALCLASPKVAEIRRIRSEREAA